jgi:hypothetical protein
MNKERLEKLSKEDLYEESLKLNESDIEYLVDTLNEKDDEIRYKSLLLLQYIAEDRSDVYKYWDILVSKLKDPNSYQRNIGINLISRLTRWDDKNKINDSIDSYLNCLEDEKPITIRICIQNLKYIVMNKEDLMDKIIDRLVSLDISKIKETMRKSVVIDIIGIFNIIGSDDIRIRRYYDEILNSDTFDSKVKKEFKNTIKDCQ